MCRHIFDYGNWEHSLEEQFLEPSPERKRCVYVASPLGAATKPELLENMRRAREYMYYIYTVFGLNARAPHAYLPMLLNDFVPAERAIGLEWGIKLLQQSDVLALCGDRLSDGMREEVLYAEKIGIPIVVFNQSVYDTVVPLLKPNTALNLLTFISDHKALGVKSPKDYLMNH